MTPSGGTVTVLQRTLTPENHPRRSLRERRAWAREIGQIFQGLHLVSRLTALDNTLIGALVHVTGWRSWFRIYSATLVKQGQAALQSVGIVQDQDIRVDRLSGGERQKIAIARLLMQHPKLILADEPTAALDPSAAAEVCRLLLHAAQHATLVTVVHNVSLLPLFADRVIGLQHGKIVFDVPIKEVDEHVLHSLYQTRQVSP